MQLLPLQHTEEAEDSGFAKVVSAVDHVSVAEILFGGRVGMVVEDAKTSHLLDVLERRGLLL